VFDFGQPPLTSLLITTNLAFADWPHLLEQAKTNARQSIG
jgi:hypothetical protein